MESDEKIQNQVHSVFNDPQNSNMKRLIDMEEDLEKGKKELENEEKNCVAKRKHLEELAKQLEMEKSADLQDKRSKHGLGNQSERKQDMSQQSTQLLGDKQNGTKSESQEAPRHSTNEFKNTPKAENSKLQDLTKENKILKEQLVRFERVIEDILKKYIDVSNKDTKCETDHQKHTNMETTKNPNITTSEIEHDKNVKTESLRKLFEKLENDKGALHEQMNVLEEQKKHLEKDITRVILENDDMSFRLQAQRETHEASENQLKSERDELLLRLSKFAGEKLAFNNPAIADLSDQNRPTKLGEFFSELYDNEWTNAFDGLEKGGFDETAAVETLRLTLESVMQFCESKADLLLQRASDAVNLLFEENKESVTKMDAKVLSETMPNQRDRNFEHRLRHPPVSVDALKLQVRWEPKHSNKSVGQRPKSESEKEQTRIDADNKLKQLRKDMATSMIPVVQKAYIAAFWTNEFIEELKPYIRKCLYLCWMMVVQSPPMVLHTFSGEKEKSFDKNMYRAYKKSGPLVSYVVWPALMLNKDGPLVCKGVAEGKTV